MSQTGSIAYYITNELQNPEDALMKLVRWLGADMLLYAERTIGESREWDLSKRYDRNEISSPYPESENLCERCPPDRLAGLYRPGTELRIDFSTAPRTSVFSQVHAQLSEELRGDFNPGTPIVSLGWHDLIDERPDEECHLVRAFLTVRVWGYGTPANDPRYRKEIWGQPFAQDFERELAALVAPHPLHHAVMFSY